MDHTCKWKCKTIRCLEENTGESLNNIGLRKELKVDKFDLIK